MDKVEKHRPTVSCLQMGGNTPCSSDHQRGKTPHPPTVQPVSCPASNTIWSIRVAAPQCCALARPFSAFRTAAQPCSILLDLRQEKNKTK